MNISKRKTRYTLLYCLPFKNGYLNDTMYFQAYIESCQVSHTLRPVFHKLKDTISPTDFQMKIRLGILASSKTAKSIFLLLLAYAHILRFYVHFYVSRHVGNVSIFSLKRVSCLPFMKKYLLSLKVNLSIVSVYK